MARMTLGRSRGLALARAEDFVESYEHQARFRQAKPLVEMAADDRLREIGARRQSFDRLVEDRQLQVVIAQQFAQSRRIRWGRRNEDDSLALPTFQAFDEGRERGL